MRIKVVTPPVNLPVTVTETKEHLRIDASDDDQDIERKIKAVVATLDPPNGILGRAMITQTLKLSLREPPPAWIELPFPPVQSIAGVTYINESEVETTISSAKYYLKNNHEPAYLILKDTETWPTDISNNDPYPFRIDFVCGYGDDPEDVPEAIRLGIMMAVGDFYLHRENILLSQNVSIDFTKRIFDNYIWRYLT